MGPGPWSQGRPTALRAIPENEVSARLVAAGVVCMSVLAIAFDLKWMTAVLAYGFVARVLTGPTLSPLGQLVTRVVTPRLGIAPHPVAGPPKRFAQGMGAAFSLTALVLTLLGYWTAAGVVLGLLVVAAVLESAFAICLGCITFGMLMRTRVVSDEVCALQRHLGRQRARIERGGLIAA